MPLSLAQVVADFAAAFKAVDTSAPVGSSRTRSYKPGIGPLTEDEAVSRALIELNGKLAPGRYSTAAPAVYPGSRQKCDLLIPDEWAIEFKLIRPFGDNGKEAEHWSENIIHPYPGNTSCVGDCLKLLGSGFKVPKAVIVFGYEHKPALIPLEPAVGAFEVIVEHIHRIRLGQRCEAAFDDLIHPVHQRGLVCGWEILGLREGAS